MKVIDNFLREKDFRNLANIILKDNFPWFYNEFKSYEGDNSFQFTHNFFRNEKMCTDDFLWNLVLPIINKLKVSQVIRVKANLTTKKTFNIRSEMHIDTGIKNSKTAVFYCNTNNGSTLFQNGKKVISKENRIAIFDGHQKHCGVDCTDETTRVVINFNYFESNL